MGKGLIWKSFMKVLLLDVFLSTEISCSQCQPGKDFLETLRLITIFMYLALGGCRGEIEQISRVKIEEEHDGRNAKLSECWSRFCH